MNSPVKLYRPRIGMRFQIRGSEFEICYAEMGMVRYAGTKGGKPHKITCERFTDLQKDNEIAILNGELHAQDEIDGTATLVNLTDQERELMFRRRNYALTAIAELPFPNSIRHLNAWIPDFAASIGDQNPPSARTVSSWVKKHFLDGDEAFMAPERKRGNRSMQFSVEMETLIFDAVGIFLQEEQRDAKDVLSYIVGKLAEKNLLTKDGAKVVIPSERTIRRRLSSIDPYLLVRIKKGPLAAEKMAKAAGKSIISPRPLYLVQIDTHYLKVFVIDPDTGEILGKPYLSCAFDVRTRCVVGIYVNLLPPSTTTTLGALKDMLTRPAQGLPGGTPVCLIPDNGTEFKNTGVERLVCKLKINFQPAQARDPNGKAHVESFFRTLSIFVIQKIKGTTFSNLSKREGYDSEAKAYATLEQIEKYIRHWIENEYHQRPHSTTGRIPLCQWEEETAHAKPLYLSEGVVDAIARRPYQCCINQGRVQVNKLVYFSHALRTLENQYSGKVTVLINELDLDNAYIEHPFEKSTLIKADSVDHEYTQGLSVWEHEEAQKLKATMTKQDLKAIGKYANLLARWQFMEMIQKDSKVAPSKIAKILQGKGRLSQQSGNLIEPDYPAIPPSTVAQPGLGNRSVGIDLSDRALDWENLLGSESPQDMPEAKLTDKPDSPTIIFEVKTYV